MSVSPIALSSAVSVRGLHKSFGSLHVLDDVDLEIGPNEFVALLGASGSGKTTLLRILAGMELPDAGDVWVPDVRTVVFQETRLVQSKKVWRNVALGLPRSSASRAAATRALNEVGLADKAQAWPATLSGGQAQRVALARALVREPALLLLDEPFAALDALTRLRMHDLIRQLRARHRPATLLVTHDVDEAIVLADRIAVLVEGQIRLWVDVADRVHSEVRTQLLEALGVEDDRPHDVSPLRQAEPTHVSTPTTSGTSSSVTYDGANNILTYTDTSGTVTFEYDPTNQVSGCGAASELPRSCLGESNPGQPHYELATSSTLCFERLGAPERHAFWAELDGPEEGAS